MTLPGLRITGGPTPFVCTVHSVVYTFSAGSPVYVPVEHRAACITAATAAGVTLTDAII